MKPDESKPTESKPTETKKKKSNPWPVAAGMTGAALGVIGSGLARDYSRGVGFFSKEGYARGFLKAAQQEGLSGQDLFDLLKYGSPGLMPTLMGAIPGAALGGYIGYDRALDGQKKEQPPEEGAPEISEEGEVPPMPPQASGPSPGMSGLVGALLGAGAGGLAGAGAGAVGWERGVNDLAGHNRDLLQALNSQYAGA